MSSACNLVPTQTLYGTSVVTITRPGEVSVETRTVDDEVVTITATEDGDVAVQTRSSPTATLFSTSCSTQQVTQAPPTMSTSVRRTTVERVSTRPGGGVIVVTDVQTISSQIVVFQTQTPDPVASDLNAADAGQHGSHTGAIVGGTVAAVVVLAGLFAVFVWYFCRKRRSVRSDRNLDEFFSDPTSAAWAGSGSSGNGEESGGAMAATRTGTLRSLHRKSAPVLDLEKEKNSSSNNDDTHWAAMQRIESAQEGDFDDQDDAEMRPSNYGARPSSRQSLATLGRPMSFHSMSAGHQLDNAVLNGEKDLSVLNPALLRNDSDQSSKYDKTPNDESPNNRSFDALPTFYGNNGSTSPPLVSPYSTSPPYVNTPYGSPPLNGSLGHEAALLPSSPINATAPLPSPATAGFPLPTATRNGRINGPMPSHAADGGDGAFPSKSRTWSTGTFNSSGNPFERPKSAQGLSSGSLMMSTGGALPSMFTSPQMQQSPPHSPTRQAINIPYSDAALAARYPLRGRASLNGGQPHYPNASHAHRLQRSPPFSPVGELAQFPPSQYGHLDNYKTEAELAEDRKLQRSSVAVPTLGSISAAASSNAASAERAQRRHRSLSGDLLLRVMNSDQQPAKSAFSTPSNASSRQMTPNSSSENSDNRLSVRNADGAKSS